MAEKPTAEPESELPSYSSVSAQKKSPTPVAGGSEHSKSLENDGRKWLSLYVKSRSGNSSTLPVFLEGDSISGRVEIDLQKAETIKGIVIEVRAGTTFVGQDEILFLKVDQTLWTPTGSSKVNGRHVWPFSFTLPKETQVKEPNGKTGMYPLPPNFSERASAAYIDYQLIVTVKRGMLRVNQTLSTNFGYYPSVFADPPSSLRRLAYTENSPLIGPDGDPEGWKMLPPIKVTGSLFSVKEVDIECQLAIATPLCYAVGTPIPLVLTFTGQDTQALDTLAAPSAIRLCLVRSMATGSDALEKPRAGRTDNLFLETCGQAYFWPSHEGGPEDNKRVLQGELEVAKILKPSFEFPRFTIRYSLDFQPFEAPGYIPSADEPQLGPLLSEQVKIVTRPVPGLVFRSHAPPGYEKPHTTDYNKSVGLLENGNQRFYHHHPGW
ncbi:hypothetical protein BDQ12DRAFT_772139 [Crucibulum laeve]|uniref:Arrestin-like N-terminal domain-containing protein n=1 Tax=Crucibulum laeve TaxID=68775 RepID=A0A5C3M4I8_9AGAR|nr:hypothetical protein BDQ12DRAFT_772139 [Crucibulum laeve]